VGGRQCPVGDLVDSLGMIDAAFWRGRRVLVTGHTGFKGAWLSLWLQNLGARVCGLSVDVPTEPSLYEVAGVRAEMHSEARLDIRDFVPLREAVLAADPEVIIHMAAQSLVRPSFADPRTTFDTNVMGTVNVLEAARSAPSARVIVVVTSDKCYENREWDWGYREDEAMGGHDPYSSSKGAAELVTAAYRRSFFADDGAVAVATARAGNVIGGGDWAPERLLPDIVRCAATGETLRIRNPGSIRPWQHVVNPLSGYLRLAQLLWDDRQLAGGWNFGPFDDDARTVAWMVQRMSERWQGRLLWEPAPGPHPHEAGLLKLDSSRARRLLGWRPTVALEDALDSIVDWHEALAAGADMRRQTVDQLDRLIPATV
jgi:CDP-glucose 4,6-dehydratase